MYLKFKLLQVQKKKRFTKTKKFMVVKISKKRLNEQPRGTQS